MQSVAHVRLKRPNSGGELHHRSLYDTDWQIASHRLPHPSQLCGALLSHIAFAPLSFLSFLLFALVSVFCL
jgi:hypothetical protein